MMMPVSERHYRIRNSMVRFIEGRQVIPRQDSTDSQLYELWMVAAKLGMYDAADWLWKNAKLEEK